MSASKRKGSAFEREVVDYLRTRDLDVSRRFSPGHAQDRGDVEGLVRWTIECKNHASLQLAEWQDETERERLNDKTEFGLLVVKRRIASIARAYAIMRLDNAADLINITENIS